MKSEWKLTVRFMRGHMKQQIASVLTITLFTTAILFMLFMAQCFNAANEQLAYNYYGNFGGETMFADPARVKAVYKVLLDEGAGVIETQAQVKTNDRSIPVYIGYMDDNAKKMRAIRIKEGTFPRSANEIALDQTAYYRLKLNTKVGDRVTLQINKSGKIKAVQYTLTGILYDYFDHWNQLTENALDYKDPKLPSVLLGQNTESFAVVHVMYPDSGQNNGLGGKYLRNPEEGRIQEYVSTLNRSTVWVTIAIGAFFLILSLFGIAALAHITLQDRERFIKTLNSIGLTSGERCTLFLMQGGILAVSAWVISVPLSMVTLALAFFIANLLGITLSWSISIWPVIVTLILISGFTLLIFLIQNYKNLATSKQKLRKKLVASSSRTFNQVWSKLYHKSRFGKNTAITILNAGCIFALVFGIFSAELSGAAHCDGISKSLGSTDYNAYIAQGILSEQEFNAGFPRNMGMSKQDVENLRGNKNIIVKYAYVDSIMMPAFFKVKPGETNKALNSLIKNCSLENKDHGDAKMAKDFSKTCELFGYKKNESLVTYPEIMAVDTDTMKTLLKEADINDVQDWTAFEQGKVVYSIGGIFKKDDKLDITMPIIPKGSTASQIVGKATKADFNVTVANDFIRSDENTYGIGNFSYGSSKSPCVIISADAAMGADTQLQFSYVIADNANPRDTISCSKASEAIHKATAVSKGMAIADKAENIAEWDKIVNQQKCPIYVLVVTFMAILIEAVAFITNIKLKTNQRSYALLRSVGMEESRLRQNLINDSLRCAGYGIIIGLILSSVLIILLVKHYWYISMKPVILHVVLPIAISGSVLLLLFTMVTTALTVRNLLKKGIAESLQILTF